MIEVEIRAKTNNIGSLKNKIIKLGGKHLGTEKQVDKIYGRDKDLDKDHKIIEGRFSARVRQKGEKMFVELKEIRRAGAGIEISSPLAKIDDGVYFLTTLDYKEAFTISKNRESFKIDNFEILPLAGQKICETNKRNKQDKYPNNYYFFHFCWFIQQ